LLKSIALHALQQILMSYKHCEHSTQNEASTHEQMQWFNGR